MTSNRYPRWEGPFAASADGDPIRDGTDHAASARHPFPEGAHAVKAERSPVQRPRSVRVAAVAGDKAAQRDRPNALRVTSRNHFVCTVCGRTLMTGERAQRDTLRWPRGGSRLRTVPAPAPAGRLDRRQELGAGKPHEASAEARPPTHYERKQANGYDHRHDPHQPPARQRSSRFGRMSSPRTWKASITRPN